MKFFGRCYIALNIIQMGFFMLKGSLIGIKQLLWTVIFQVSIIQQYFDQKFTYIICQQNQFAMETMQSLTQRPLIDNLRKTLEMIQNVQYNIEQDKMNELTINEIAFKDIRQKYNKQTSEQKQLIRKLQKRLYQLQSINENLQEEENKKQKQELKKCYQTLNEKDSQLQNLRNQIIWYKNRIESLECQILTSKSQKQKAQLFIAKGFQQLMIDLKQSTSSVEEVLIQKIVLQNKYQLLHQKLNHTLKNFQDLEINNQKLQDKYIEVKTERKMLQQKCMNFQFQIAQTKNKFFIANFTQSLENNYKKQFPLQQKQINVLAQIRRLSEDVQNIKRIQSKLSQIGQLQKSCEILSNKNNLLQSNNFKLQDQLNLIKCSNNLIDQNYILKQNSPTLYEFFCKKRQDIKVFEEKLDSLQKKLMQKDKTINNLLHEQNNLKNKQEWQKNLQTQLKNLRQSLQEEYETNLEVLKNNYQKYHSEATKAIQENLNEANIEIDKLKSCIDSLQSSKKKKEVMLQQIKKSTLQTNNLQKLEKENSTMKNLLNAEEIKNKHLKKSIILYRKELANLIIPQTGKNKRTKKPVIRCCECYLQFQKNNLQQKCQKCKKIFHSVMCYGEHECLNTSNLTTSIKKSERSNSQFDYF